MNKRKIIRNLSIFLLLGALVALGALWVWNGPHFDRQPNLAAAAPEVVLAAAEANQPAEAVFQPQLAPQNARVGASDNPAATPTPTGQSACSSVGSLSALILGIDENEQADAIRLMRVDFAQERISVVSIPRDFWVPVADMQAHGIKFGRINATYGYGEFYNGNGGGIKSLTANIQSNFGVSVDRYFLLPFADIEKYIDQIGGVDVTLEEPVWDTAHSFTAGAHHLDGATAVLFMRMREGDSDFFRVRRQSLVLSAFYKKIMHELSVWQLVKLGVSVIGDHAILTNFNAKDVYTLACLAGRINGEDVAFIEIPKDLYHPMTTNLGASVIIPHDGVAAFLQSVMEGSYKPEEK